MPDAETIIDAVADLAANPASVTAGDRTVTEQRIGDVIEAAKFVAGQAAAAGQNSAGGPRSPWNALRPAKAIPPGAV